jgi:hypothetical protein
MDKHLNIIALNIPWPANYGGVIDIFYKLKALHQLGVKIILHTFEYDRPPAMELEEYCEQVYYYPRHTGLFANFSLLPYNVVSRKNPLLLTRLLKNTYPILFEGLHTCYYLADERLRGRKKIVRASNIEHDYYWHLFKAEKNPIKKAFFGLESWRFKRFEPIVRHADILLAISTQDEESLKSRYPEKRVEFMPAFHANNRITAMEGQSDFLLYHAKLSVVENECAALFLINQVFSQLNYTCIIAGMNPSKALLKAAEPYPHIRIEANPTTEQMNGLIANAQIHVLVTFQDTGLKLKLLNSLFAGRHVLVNAMMLAGSGLERVCHLADSPKAMIDQCRLLMERPFTEEMIQERYAVLWPTYDNAYQAKRLDQLIYGYN